MLDTITVVGLGVTGKSFFVYAQKFSAGLCIFPLQSSALLFCHTHFKQYVDKLKAKYDKVYLIRNERQLAIYSFDGGERFEPDYLLFLHSPKVNGYEQLQIFIEPKGTHLVKNDSWKEDFLLQLESNAIPIVKFADDNNYRIWGFHFFNRDLRRKEFDEDMNRLL